MPTAKVGEWHSSTLAHVVRSVEIDEALANALKGAS